MKNSIFKNSSLLALTGALLLTSACYRSADRPPIVNKAIAANLFEMKDMTEITGAAKSVYVQGGDKASVTALDASIKQLKIDGSRMNDVIAKVKGDATKSALTAQLKDGAVAIVVLKDQIKILKVVPDLDLSMNYDVLSLKYMSTMKTMAKTSDLQQQSLLAKQLDDLKYTSPRKLSEKFGLVEITSIKIVKTGTLENERTDYDEKKSTLNVVDKPLELSTHIILGDEVGASKSADGSPSADQAAE